MTQPKRGAVASFIPRLIIPVVGFTDKFKAMAKAGDMKVRVQPESTRAQTLNPAHKTGAMTSFLLVVGKMAKVAKSICLIAGCGEGNDVVRSPGL